MRFFTNELYDINGYLKQLKLIQTRISDDIYEFFTTISFHDAHIYSLHVKNTFNPDDDEDDPTRIEAHLLHRSGVEYIVTWIGVNKFLMDYDIQRNTYVNSDEIVCDGQRGLDDWIVDEITAYDDHYLSHEIILASDAQLNIRFTGIEIKKL